MKFFIEDGCIGCGLCEQTCPEVFALNSDGFAEVIAEADSETEQSALEAKENCPVSVIEC